MGKATLKVLRRTISINRQCCTREYNNINKEFHGGPITTSIEKEKPDVSIEIPTQVRKTNPHVHVYHCMYMYTITYLRNKYYILRNTQSL